MSVLTLLIRGFFGITVIIGIAYALSSDRKAIDWRVVASGIGLQLLFALVVLKSAFGRDLFESIGYGFAEYEVEYQKVIDWSLVIANCFCKCV